MVGGYKIKESTRDHVRRLSEICRKTERRSKKKKNMKLDDSTEHTLIEPIHIYLRSVNHDTGNAFHSFSIVPSLINHCIESYWPNSAALSPVGQILL